MAGLIGERLRAEPKNFGLLLTKGRRAFENAKVGCGRSTLDTWPSSTTAPASTGAFFQESGHPEFIFLAEAMDY